MMMIDEIDTEVGPPLVLFRTKNLHQLEYMARKSIMSIEGIYSETKGDHTFCVGQVTPTQSSMCKFMCLTTRKIGSTLHRRLEYFNIVDDDDVENSI